MTGENVSHMTIQPDGHELRGQMSDKEVASLKENLQDPAVRTKLAIYRGMSLYEWHKEQGIKSGEPIDPFVLANLAIGGALIANRLMELCAEEESWPTYISPPELFAKELEQANAIDIPTMWGGEGASMEVGSSDVADLAARIRTAKGING